MSALWSLGFSTVTKLPLLVLLPASDAWGFNNAWLFRTILLAKSPQITLTFPYFTYNNLFTYMLLRDEWNGYADQRKALRVTSPRGTQRSTNRLQLPYYFPVLLMVLSSLLHWLTSQAIFLVRIAYPYEQPSGQEAKGVRPYPLDFGIFTQAF